MKKYLVGFFVVLIVLMFTSCATILSDDTSYITVNSEPSGAIVKVDGFPSGTTPTTLMLDSDKSYTLEISKDGYQPQAIRVKKTIKWGWQVADLLLTGVIGNVVDLVTPNGYSLKPDSINVFLTEIK